MRLSTITALTAVNLRQAWYKITGQRQRIVPYKVVIEVTTQCNSKCLYCDIWQIKKADLAYIDLVALEDFLLKMGPHLYWLALTGGEIASYNRFPELLALIKRHCPKLKIITFTTNGLLPQRILDYALLIKKELTSDLFITISLDGDEETHDAIRGIKGNYIRCMDTYRLLRENCILCHFGITVAEGNEAFIKERFKDYRQEIKAVTFVHHGGIFLTSDEKKSKEADESILRSMMVINSQYKVAALGEWLIKIYLKAAIKFLKQQRKSNIIPCDVGSSSAHLMANGALHACMYLPPIKQINEGFELSDYHSPAALAMLADIKKDKCPHCWMNCYAPHSILQSPLRALSVLLNPAP
jgi:hypothetical protein